MAAAWRNTAAMQLLDNTLGKMKIPKSLDPADVSKIPPGLSYVQLNDRLYPVDRAEQVYRKASIPKEPFVPTNKDLQWYQGKEIPADVSVVTPVRVDGKVQIDVTSPDEYLALGAKEAIPLVPPKAIFQTAREFNDYSHSSRGRGFFSNDPSGGLEGSRAKLYRRIGFKDATPTKQVLDTRVRLGRVTDDLYNFFDDPAYLPSNASIPSLVENPNQAVPPLFTPYGAYSYRRGIGGEALATSQPKLSALDQELIDAFSGI